MHVLNQFYLRNCSQVNNEVISVKGVALADKIQKIKMPELAPSRCNLHNFTTTPTRIIVDCAIFQICLFVCGSKSQHTLLEFANKAATWAQASVFVGAWWSAYILFVFSRTVNNQVLSHALFSVHWKLCILYFVLVGIF